MEDEARGMECHLNDGLSDHSLVEDDDDTDDELMMMETPLIVLHPDDDGKHPPQHDEKPWKDFTLNDNAIVECLSLSIQAHIDKDGNTKVNEWQPAYNEWKPQPVPLPVWAIPNGMQIDKVNGSEDPTK